MRVVVTTPYSKGYTKTGTVVGTRKINKVASTVVKLDKATPDGAKFTFINNGGYVALGHVYGIR